MNKTLTQIICAAALTIIAPLYCFAQQQKLQIVDKLRRHKQQMQTDSTFRMVEIKGLIPEARYQLHYATATNFTGKKLYRKATLSFLRLPVATALHGVQQSLKRKGYGIIIWDAYRPYAVTKKMWRLIHDERYVANPAKGSGHNRGIAVDLTLYDLKSGEDLDMGTAFDHFSDTAHHSFTALTATQLHNRSLLKNTMIEHGFKPLETEWWHYSYAGQSFPVLDLSFRKLAKVER